MPEIKSSIGSRSFSTSAGSRVVDIPDETEGSDMHSHAGPVGFSPQEVSQEELRARQRQMQALKRAGGGISPQAKGRIEFLTNLGRKTKDVPVDETIFSIRTLKGSETREAIMATADCSNLERPFEARKQYLARAIYAIDNNEIALVLGTDDLGSRLQFIDELDDNVIGFVYGEWVKLNNEASSKFAVKNDEDMKEVLEDIKK